MDTHTRSRRIRRKTVDMLAVAALFLAILPITVLLDWEERQQRGAR